jgi:NADH-quinone oxidoreductase subunit M
MLTAIILCPLLAALLLCVVPRNFGPLIRGLAVLATFIAMILAIVMFWRFDGVRAGPSGVFKFEAFHPWVESLGINYHVGVDGLNVGLILMGAVVAFAATCCGWEVRESGIKREKEFYILLLVMAGGILGAFASLDLFFFYFAHELALVPTFIMIGVWGRGEDKNYATFQITVYLSLGALIALVGLIALYLQFPPAARTFNLVELTRYAQQHPISARGQSAVFPLLLFGFGILVSLWPFHTWAPPGYGSAPTPTAMLHAGVLKKFGLYGLIRIALPLLPQAAHQWMTVLAWLCLGNIFYCGLVAMRQKNFDWLLGYSSVAHMGFAFLGIASLTLVGVTGAVLVMIAHGFLAALSFGLSGYLLHTTGTLEMERLGGLLRKLPFLGGALMMAMFAGCGLPGFANFTGEVTVFFGSWKPFPLVTGMAVWGALVIGAVYMLRALRTMLHGPLPESWMSVAESNWPLRKLPYLVLLAALLVFGFFPRLLSERIASSTERIMRMAGGPAGGAQTPGFENAQAPAVWSRASEEFGPQLK